MPQMSPMMWIFFPVLLMFISIIVVSIINLMSEVELMEEGGEGEYKYCKWCW